MRMTARGGAIAAIGYLPVQLADDKTRDVKILPPVNHDCQSMNFSEGTRYQITPTQLEVLMLDR